MEPGARGGGGGARLALGGRRQHFNYHSHALQTQRRDTPRPWRPWRATSRAFLVPRSGARGGGRGRLPDLRSASPHACRNRGDKL